MCIRDRGVEVPSLKRERKWDFQPSASAGEMVSGGDILGTVQETEVENHKIMVPPGMKGTLTAIYPGEMCIRDS